MGSRRALRARSQARTRRTARPPSLSEYQQRRVDVGRFFALFLRELIGGREPPSIPEALRIDPQLERTCEVIRELHERHRDRLQA